MGLCHGGRHPVHSEGGYVHGLGQVEIVRYKANAEAVFRARAAEINNQQTRRPLGL